MQNTQDKINKLKRKIQEVATYGEIRNIVITSAHKDYIHDLKLHYSFNFSYRNLGEYFSFIIEYWNPVDNKIIHYYCT